MGWTLWTTGKLRMFSLRKCQRRRIQQRQGGARLTIATTPDMVAPAMDEVSARIIITDIFG
jgi:hypothetical protein